MALRKVTIEDFVSYDPVSVDPGTSLDRVVDLLEEHRFRHLPVVDGGRAVGIISDRDLLLARTQGALELIRAREVMSPAPYAVPIDAPLEEVALELSKRKFGSAIVNDRSGAFCGIFTATDALNALVELLRERA